MNSLEHVHKLSDKPENIVFLAINAMVCSKSTGTNNKHMSLIRLGELTINTDSQIVMLQGEEIRLEPRLYELLLLFCEKSEEIVTREHILDNIWQGTIVTDNAVSKLVASLRKQLKDNPSNPQYIQTVPKRGYRLVAEKTLFQNTESELTSVPENTAQQFGSKMSITTVLAFVLVALLAIWGGGYFNTDESEKLTSGHHTEVTVKALTRMSGLERSPIISEDQQFILYLREDIQTGHRSLWHKNLSNEQTQKIPGVTPFASRLVSLTQENTGWQLLYLAQENDSCRLSKLEISPELSIVSDGLLLDCTGLEIFDASFSKKRNSLYYSAKAENGLQARVYQLDLDSSANSLITQPEIQGKGNRGIDLSPDEEKLLIVQLDKQYNSQLYVLNLQSNDVKPLFFVPHNIAQASWDNDSQHILYFAPFPSRQILRNDESGSNQQVVLTMSDYVEAAFSRIPNSQDILFSTINRDYNNRWIVRADGVKEITNSTVYDTRPTLAHNRFSTAFISTRNGQRELYFGDLTNGTQRLFARLKKDRGLRLLSFSPDDSTLLVGDKSHIWLVDVNLQSEGNSLLDLSPEAALVTANGLLRHAEWLNDDLIYFRVEEYGKNLGYLYRKNTNSVVPLTARWASMMTDHQSPEYLYLVDDKDNRLHFLAVSQLNLAPEQTMVIPEHALQATKVYLPQGYRNLKVHNGNLYYQVLTDNNHAKGFDYQIEVMSLSGDEGQERQAYQTRCSCGFDVADSGFIVSELNAMEGDIYRTVR